jgi:hypothetical protein
LDQNGNVGLIKIDEIYEELATTAITIRITRDRSADRRAG